MDAKKTVLEVIEKIIIKKLCKKEAILSSDVNREVLKYQQLFKNSREPFYLSKNDARKVFMYVKSKLVTKKL